MSSNTPTYRLHLFDPSDPATDCDHAYHMENLVTHLDNGIDIGLAWAYGAYAEQRAIEHYDKALTAFTKADFSAHDFHTGKADQWFDLRNDFIDAHDRTSRLRSN